jgi:choline kinase
VSGERSQVRQSVILAAGFGERMGSGGHGTPKPLMEVAGRPLIEYALAQAHAAGCGEAVIIVGNGGSLVKEYLGSREFPLRTKAVHNPEFQWPNGVSLLAAEDHVEGSFFLQMSDHLFGEAVLGRLAHPGAAPDDSLRLLVDRQPFYSDEEDATKVRLAGEMITDIGKEIRPWDAVDTGCFLLDSRVFDALREVGRPEERSVTAAMLRLSSHRQLAAVQLRGVTWVDVDTMRDRDEAERLFGAAGPYGWQ